jgi:hypothetical protein
MLSSIIQWAISRRWLVILGAIVITVWIFRTIIQMPLDVFPTFAPPQVEIQTEAPGTRARRGGIAGDVADRERDQWHAGNFGSALFECRQYFSCASGVQLGN